LITNSIRYFQRCEGVRPDVQLVDQSMLTYPWFVRVQSPNFPHFTFPGTNYHPFTPGSFSIRQLVEANMDDGKGELFMAGGWNPQDDSHVGHFQQLPVGYVDRIVRTGRSELDEDVIRYLRRHVAHLPNFTLPERTFGDVRPPARSHCIMHRVSSTASCIVCRPLHHASCVVHCIMHRVSSTASCIVCRPLHHRPHPWFPVAGAVGGGGDQGLLPGAAQAGVRRAVVGRGTRRPGEAEPIEPNSTHQKEPLHY
jgi:hypothetical protein